MAQGFHWLRVTGTIKKDTGCCSAHPSWILLCFALNNSNDHYQKERTHTHISCVLCLSCGVSNNYYFWLISTCLILVCKNSNTWSQTLITTVGQPVWTLDSSPLDLRPFHQSRNFFSIVPKGKEDVTLCPVETTYIFFRCTCKDGALMNVVTNALARLHPSTHCIWKLHRELLYVGCQ